MAGVKLKERQGSGSLTLTASVHVRISLQSTFFSLHPGVNFSSRKQGMEAGGKCPFGVPYSANIQI